MLAPRVSRQITSVAYNSDHHQIFGGDGGDDDCSSRNIPAGRPAADRTAKIAVAIEIYCDISDKRLNK